MLYTIQVSAHNEWESVKSCLLPGKCRIAPFGETFNHRINDAECVFFQGGSSKTRSAASCQYAISRWKPDRHFIIGTQEGFIASADQDVDYETRIKQQSENVMVADWESGAISLICKCNFIPVCIIRGVTDIPGNSSKECASSQNKAYIKNTPLVTRKIYKKILEKIIC